MSKPFLAAVFFLISSAAGLARADCTYSQSPSVGLSLVSPLVFGEDEVTATWAVNCQGQCRTDWQEGGGITLSYASAPTIAVPGGCDGTDGQTDADACGLSLIGVKVVAKLTSYCGDPFENSGSVETTSAPLVVPPWVTTSDQLRIVPPIGDYAHADAFSDALHVPVGVPFRITGLISVTPAGSDTATFRVEGAGIHLTRTYGVVVDGEGNPMEQGAAWSADPSPEANAVATQPGDFQFWVELDGTKSEVRTLHAVDLADAGSDDGSGTSGSDETAESGCTSAPGGLLLALLGVGALGLRKRRPS